MNEYIDRDAAIAACFDGFADCRDDCAANIRSIPAADVRPVVRGDWETHFDLHSSVCSNCKAWWIPFGEGYKTTYHFCPNCGAEMRPRPKEGSR